MFGLVVSSNYHVMLFLAAAKHISAELITISTLLSEDKIVVFCWPWFGFFFVGVASQLDDEDSSSKSPSILPGNIIVRGNSQFYSKW